MNVKQALGWAIKKLNPPSLKLRRTRKLNSPVLDAEVLLSFILKKDKTFLFAHPEKKLTAKQLEKYKKIITRRAKHEPVAYITNDKEFYGLDFYVDKNVLIPRPETELIVDEAIKIIKDSKHKILLVDIGTGSGCVAVSIVKNTKIKAVAIDYSKPALKIAKKNAEKHGVASRIQFVYSNLLENIKLRNYENNEITKTIITANLPYLTTEQYKKLSPDIKKYEPRSALVGGKDGLRYCRELLRDVDSRLSLAGDLPQVRRSWNDKGRHGNDVIVLLEIDPHQAKPIKKIIKEILPKAEVEIKIDLAKRDRLVAIKTKN
ncbi:MAG: peptide chain release factor N(5)-glutamine methyltransferase [Parcubacteria group bacterium]|nr:peptide chain release factor N(5)-glutamine methyltransferase [Parcubacteria group bacterium]